MWRPEGEWAGTVGKHDGGLADLQGSSLRSTEEQLSKCRLAPLRIAFQLPTPFCERLREYAVPHKKGDRRGDADAIVALDVHLRLFRRPLFTSTFLGGRACEPADLTATLDGPT